MLLLLLLLLLLQTHLYNADMPLLLLLLLPCSWLLLSLIFQPCTKRVTMTLLLFLHCSLLSILACATEMK